MADLAEHIDKNRLPDISLEEVRSVSMFAHLDDEQAEKVIESFKQLSLIIFEYYITQQRKKNRNS